MILGQVSHLSGVPQGFFMVVDKPLHMTSFQVISKLRKTFGIKRIGHAGTLDPLASGVLPIAVGDACRLLSYVVSHQKVYDFTVEWGRKTDTADLEGTFLQDSPIEISYDCLQACLSSFVGGYYQTPPSYSAIRIKGERSYDLARRGEHVELGARFVDIKDLVILEHKGSKTTFRVTCGKGTYVRSLAEDIAKEAGTCGVVSYLRRLEVGNFSLSCAMTLESLTENTYKEEDHILHLGDVLVGIPAWSVPDEIAIRVRHGQRIRIEDDMSFPCFYEGEDKEILLYDSNNVLVAVAMYDGHLLHPRHVFKE